MKKLTLILALSIALASCKKQNNTPSQQTTQNSTTTPTPTPTPTTTVVDTVGKRRVIFSASLIDVITIPFDYKYDTLNTRIRLNQTHISCVRNISFEGNLTALSRIQSNPIWMGSGDSLVVEFDSLEYNSPGSTGNPCNSLNGGLSITELYFNSSGVLVANTLTPAGSSIPLKDWSIFNPVATDHNLGVAKWKNGIGAYLNNYWFVGKRTKIVYIKP